MPDEASGTPRVHQWPVLPFLLLLNGAEIPDNVLEPQSVCWGRVQKAVFH